MENHPIVTLSRFRYHIYSNGDLTGMRMDGPEATEFSIIKAKVSSMHSPKIVDSPKSKVARIRASSHIKEPVRRSTEKKRRKPRRKLPMDESEGAMVFTSGNDLGESEIVI
eukprot:CAMPEP_0184490852 /NCGR_PEP_ID=MMETSP0113_2-20130426/19090_1 /TAXON_ID=91329 /ORGANISM="Norrisiella sphaerica, Strain BC52" /LENGTH=110 /DNA_ID=CAMNT_0026874967 /DNA_START=56 /DNA_END=388 /DNA_ORIENTATION=+